MNISGLSWIRFHSVSDERGSLTAIEGREMAPFEIKRVFFMHDIAKGADRGGHAHRDTDQLAVAVHGSLKIVVSNGYETRVVMLDSPTWGITLPRMTWTRLADFSEGAVCLVLASTHYDRSKSIRTWPEYLLAREIPIREELTTGLLLERPAR